MYHLRHDEIVLSPRVRGFQSVLGCSLLVFVKTTKRFFFYEAKNVLFWGGVLFEQNWKVRDFYICTFNQH